MSIQQLWFDQLVQDREENAKILEKPSMSGIKTSVVEKYSDQAHFVYELLQNANDAGATSSTFKLTDSGLFFKHNGTTHFVVSDPNTEHKDKQTNTLGHVNSITAIANSNKSAASAIGKFGVGFKAVFQYTETPHVYDPNFQFKIERFIIPVKLNANLSLRETDETVFYFPFDKPDMPAEKAYAEILEKLKNLSFPTLFLSSLREVKWTTEDEEGKYDKKNGAQQQFTDIVYEKIELHQHTGDDRNKESLYLFSRFTKENHRYSVGFFLDKAGKLTAKQFPVFCFFPTKETTNLNFILHAPFLLTDSREGIHRSKEHNREMVILLSKLAADSLLILKELGLVDDEITELIPYKKMDYGHDNFFGCFFEEVKHTLRTTEILPASGHTFTNRENAYWADSPELANLFSNEQLAELVGNAEAKWVFTTIGRSKDKDLTDYIDGGSEKLWDKKEPNLVRSTLDFENKIADLISPAFTKGQSNEWLHRLYDYLAERKSYQDKYKSKPIFKDKDGNAAAAFERSGKELHGILFLPLEDLDLAYKTINAELLKNDKTREFLEHFGLKQPSLKDEVYNNILPQYETEEGIDTKPHFELFFKHWREDGKPEAFINLIKDKSFILYRSQDDETIYRGMGSQLYYPISDLQKYFEKKTDTKFVDLESYDTFITDEAEREVLKEFLLKLGVSELPRICFSEITDRAERETILSDRGEKLKQGTAGYPEQGTFDKIIDGCEEALRDIDLDKSLLIWHVLSKLKLTSLKGFHKYFYYSQQYQHFESLILGQLKSKPWLINKQGQFVAPNEVTAEELAEGYEIDVDLERLLSFRESLVLSETERIAQKFENEEEAEEAKIALEEKREKEKRRLERQTAGGDVAFDAVDLQEAIVSLEQLSETVAKPKSESDKTNKLPEYDEDEELALGIEGLRAQLELKKNKVHLVEQINASVKYSYDWFKTYLKLLTTYTENQDASAQKSISFQEIRPYKTDGKFFLLCGASNYISSEIENADDFTITLVYGNGKRENISVEGVSKKGQDLLIYCRESLAQATLFRLSTIFKVEINFTPVIDLIDRLYTAFTNPDYIEPWEDIQQALPALDFIYGPPGTGKTTTVCQTINSLLAANPKAKFLVLTPTNKAADVVCKKLQEVNTDIYSIRLSRPTDSELEEDGIYRDALDNQSMRNINVIASTIHRLPYYEIADEKDGIAYGYKLFKHRDFDYVIFDEASMTGLHYITFAIMSLFKTNSNIKFLAAGDPKQIPPVMEINDKDLENFDFQDENIYKMMNLSSFDPAKQVIRQIDSIDNLATQYRSIPQIGQLFNELSYSGLLTHDREDNKKESPQLPTIFQNLFRTGVTFVDIPLSEDHSIYRVNKLFYSSYHSYCAILVSEIIKRFDTENKDHHWTIGLITPYKAQAILLNKLITSYSLSESIKVIADTVHGFQGDECDIVFFVCNPNNHYYSGHEKALLSKEYIYNVAISRARDYLIILHPYTAIKENTHINAIARSYKTNFGNSKIVQCKEIEMLLFGEERYIERNSYASGHDSVNVFGSTDMKYFIKSDNTAVDIHLPDLKLD